MIETNLTFMIFGVIIIIILLIIILIIYYTSKSISEINNFLDILPQQIKLINQYINTISQNTQNFTDSITDDVTKTDQSIKNFVCTNNFLIPDSPAYCKS